MWTYGPWGMFSWMWIFPLIVLVVILLFSFRGVGQPMCGSHEMPKSEGSAREILALALRPWRGQRRGISADEERS